jgi:hypothetical protein
MRLGLIALMATMVFSVTTGASEYMPAQEFTELFINHTFNGFNEEKA